MTIKEVEELIRFVAKANVSEVELETKDVKLVIKTNKAAERIVEIQAPVQHAPVVIAQPAPVKQAAPAADAAAPTPQPKADENANYVTIKSPMIGTFYRSPGPDKAPFLNVGDKIEKGKVICIIEAMKLFNEIEAEVSGTVVKFLLNDASPVEYDQPLFLVEPN
jgi:acetyl-CoA carboxylase biotin carboxyl carrier protein